MAHGPLLAGVKYLAGLAVGQGSNSKGRTAWRRWTECCNLIDFDCHGGVSGKIPAVVVNVFLWFLFKLDTVRSWEAYKGNINGLKREMARRYICTKVWDKDAVKTVLQGLRNSISQFDLPPTRAYRASCTPKLLQASLPLWRMETSTQRVTKSMSILCVDQLLRLGEIAKTQNNQGRVPLRRDLHYNNRSDSFFLRIKTKTDKWDRKTKLEIIRNLKSKDLCAVAALKVVLSDCHKDNQPDKPLFCNALGNAISDKDVMHELHFALARSKVDSKGFNTKAFRRGGALEALQKGASSDEIKKLGRWSSDSFKTYIQIDDIGNFNNNNSSSYTNTLHSIIRLVERV